MPIQSMFVEYQSNRYSSNINPIDIRRISIQSVFAESIRLIFVNAHVLRVNPIDTQRARVGSRGATEGPSWGYPMAVLGAVFPSLEPFCGHLSPKVDEIFQT